jgi:hypothetical protein
MNISENIELDSGAPATYDVQPDTRFLANYVQYNIASQYPDYNIKGHPNVSPLSIAAYCMLLINAHLLGCDAYYRPQKSWIAATFLNDQSRKDYFDVLLNCRVPGFLKDILSELAPVYDARRTNHCFVPSLAGYHHAHDFGRSLPPQIWIHAHHLLATVNSRTDPDTYQAMIYETLIHTHDNQEYYIGNFLGTHYGNEHSNWVNQDFEGFFNPLVGRALTQRPTFAKMPIEPMTTQTTSTSPQDYLNAYIYFLVADDENCDSMSTFVGSLSAFFQAHESSTVTLGSILASLSGPLIFSHSIEPPTLPTWTGLKTTIASGTPKLDTVTTDKKHADKHKYLVTANTHSGKIHFPGTDALKEIATYLFRLIDKSFDPAARHDKRIIFDPKIHINPYVLYFQPYDVNPSSLAHTIILGLKIELAEIDGFTVPTEHPESSLDDNNSQYQQSAIRLTHVETIFQSNTATNAHLSLIARRPVDRTDQAIGLAMRTMASNVLPVFANQDVDSTDIAANPRNGFDFEDNHDSPLTAFTYTAGTNGTLPVSTTTKFYGWSSYRLVHVKKMPAAQDISMVFSFRPVFGTNVTLSRSKNPALIIPH